MTREAARKAWATRRAAGGASASAQLAHRTRMRARARELGVPVFTMPRLVLSLVDAELRAWAVGFVRFVRGHGERPAWRDDPRRRDVELALARMYGIVDPAGLAFGVRPMRKRKVKGVFRGVAGQLAEGRARMRYGGWHG